MLVEDRNFVNRVCVDYIGSKEHPLPLTRFAVAWLGGTLQSCIYIKSSEAAALSDAARIANDRLSHHD